MPTISVVGMMVVVFFASHTVGGRFLGVSKLIVFLC